MFVVIPTGKTYTATVKNDYIRRCVCEKCGVAFEYTFTVSGTGTGSSVLFLRNKAAGEDAKKAAALDLERNAQKAFPPFACPNCDHFQDQMVRYFRRSRFRLAYIWSWIILGAVLAITTLMMKSVGNISMLSSPVYWEFVLGAAALVGAITLARRYSTPKAPRRQADARVPANSAAPTSAQIDEFDAMQAKTGVTIVPPPGFSPYPVRASSPFRYQRAYRSAGGETELRYRIDSFVGGPLPKGVHEASFAATLHNLTQGLSQPRVTNVEPERARAWFGADWHAVGSIRVADRRDFSPDYDSAEVLFFHKYGVADVYLIGLYNEGTGGERLVIDPMPQVTFPP